MDLDEAERSLRESGYTVTNDRALRAYYRQHEPSLKRLTDRAKGGDWVAAERLITHIVARPGQIGYSKSLTEFTEFIMRELLSRRAITSSTKPSGRLKNPLLGAVLKTDGRKDYLRNEKSREIRFRYDAFNKSGNKEYLILELTKKGIPNDTLNKLLVNAKKIG